MLLLLSSDVFRPVYLSLSLSLSRSLSLSLPLSVSRAPSPLSIHLTSDSERRSSGARPAPSLGPRPFLYTRVSISLHIPNHPVIPLCAYPLMTRRDGRMRSIERYMDRNVHPHIYFCSQCSPHAYIRLLSQQCARSLLQWLAFERASRSLFSQVYVLALFGVFFRILGIMIFLEFFQHHFFDFRSILEPNLEQKSSQNRPRRRYFPRPKLHRSIFRILKDVLDGMLGFEVPRPPEKLPKST